MVLSAFFLYLLLSPSSLLHQDAIHLPEPFTAACLLVLLHTSATAQCPIIPLLTHVLNISQGNTQCLLLCSASFPSGNLRNYS